jgi:hypothetical protein
VGYGARCLGVLLCLSAPSAALAQTAPLGVPPGVLRFEIDGNFDSWDQRFRDGRKESLAASVASSALGSDLLPLLSSADAILRRVTGLSTAGINLGTLAADAQADVASATIGLALGITRNIAIFGRLPLTRARIQTDLDLDTGNANAGASPGTTVQEPFFGQFGTALAILETQIAAGAYDGNPTQRALADETLAQGIGLFDDLFVLMGNPETASPFLPTGGSDVGTALTARIAAIQTTLGSDLGIGGFTTQPALPTTAATPADVESAISDPFGPIGIDVGPSEVTFRGDAEAGVALTLVDRWDLENRRGGFRAAAEGLVRFPTGRRARLDRLLAIGTGDGQTDVELRGVVDLGSGSLGLRLEGGYNRQLAADVTARVAPPTQAFPDRGLETVVRLDPGDVTTFAVRPFFRLARTFALIGSLERWSKGQDAAEFAGTVLPGVDPSVMTLETDASATVVSFGVTYSNPGALRPGGTGLPVDAGWTYERIVSASGGIVPDVHRIRSRVRLYFDIW